MLPAFQRDRTESSTKNLQTWSETVNKMSTKYNDLRAAVERKERQLLALQGAGKLRFTSLPMYCSFFLPLFNRVHGCMSALDAPIVLNQLYRE